MSLSLLRACRQALVAGLAVAACSEPVDCRVEPERCAGVSIAAPLRASPAVLPAAGAPAEPAPAAAYPTRRDPPPMGLAQRELGLGDGRLPGLRVGGDAAAEAAEAVQLKALFRRFGAAAKRHDVTALRPFVTDAFYARLQDTIAKHGDRLWRHLDRFEQAADADVALDVRPADDAAARQVEAQLPGGGQLKPIVRRTEQGWQFDRF